jgi:hypothetical protein
MSALGESELRDVLLVRAFEQGDTQGELLSPRERDVASRETRAELKRTDAPLDPVEFLTLRASRLRARIERSFPAAAGVMVASSRRGVSIWIVLVASILLGLGIDRLGATGSIDLLSFPILGLLSWNLLVYLMLFISDLRGTPTQSSGEGQASRAAAEGLVARGILWWSSPERVWRGARASKEAGGEVAICLQRFLRDWYRVGAPLHLARGSRLLHTAAAGVMIGAIGGLYLRGLVLHFEASWGSTFLTAEATHSILAFLFAPAAFLLGDPVPGVEEIANMRAPKGSGPAALWIHFYAVTGALLVILPRGLLAALSWRQSRRLGRALPFDLEGDAYFLRLLAVDRGLGSRALVQAYSYHPSARSSEGLTTLLLDVLGGRTGIERLEPSEYGDPPRELPEDISGAELCRVVVFTMAQSPEHEVHGEYLASLVEELESTTGEHSLLVVLDKGPFLERLPRDEEGSARLAERERSWSRVLKEVGLEGVVVSLDGLADPAGLERARQVTRHFARSGESA